MRQAIQNVGHLKQLLVEVPDDYLVVALTGYSEYIRPALLKTGEVFTPDGWFSSHSNEPNAIFFVGVSEDADKTYREG